MSQDLPEVQHPAGNPVTPDRRAAKWKRWNPIGRRCAVLFIALCGGRSAVAQTPAVGHLSPPDVVVRYARNESGGRITITQPAGDSTSIESVRLGLLEMAAAIRRGDFRRVTVVRTELPAVKVLASNSRRIRCTFRPTAKGGELVLLSDDESVIRAIHQLMAAEPPSGATL